MVTFMVGVVIDSSATAAVVCYVRTKRILLVDLRLGFRKMMDKNRWWFTLSHYADGTFYYQPNRDNNPQDYTAAPRLSATAAAALILTLPKRSLAMTKLEGFAGKKGRR